MRDGKAILLSAAISLLAIPVAADHRDRPEHDFRATIRGNHEVPVTLSAGHGSLDLHVNSVDTSMHFVLEYHGLATTVSAAHIHVGKPRTNGGVTVFFCGGGGRPACPQEGTITGDINANDVIGLAAQQLEANNFAKLLAAIRDGETYVNIHTATSPSGEIRGAIVPDKHGR